MTTHATNYMTALAQLAEVARVASSPQIIYRRRRAVTAHADADGVVEVPSQSLTSKPVGSPLPYQAPDTLLRNPLSR
jgi:hypothetical protein